MTFVRLRKGKEMKKFFLRAIIAVLLIPTFSFASEICSQVVDTSEGPVRGKEATNAPTCTYKGIPYAQPPLGELRLKAPQPPAKRGEVFNAFEFSPSCWQNEQMAIMSGGKSVSFSEDCLTLNIFRPAKEGKFPVMFWIHGGGYVQGASNYELYHGETLAGKSDVVVVTINYRLGALGFMALPQLAEEDPSHSTGNYGMLDTIQALKWVKENIKNFGGDPDNITIFGHSAGGVSVCALLASPLAKGLFHKAIIQSGACDIALPVEENYKVGRQMAQSVGCTQDDPRECLRKIPAKRFLKFKMKGISLALSIDGVLLKSKPIDAISAGDYNSVPVMVGSTKDEMNILIAMMPWTKLASRKRVEKEVRKILKDKADDLLKLYSFDDYRRPVFLIGAAVADAFGSRAFIAAEKLSAYNPVWLYQFDWDGQVYGNTMGAFHGLELPLVFGNLRLTPLLFRMFMNERVRNEVAPLSEQMMRYWTNFAKTGNPNGGGLPEWRSYDPNKREKMHFDIPSKMLPISPQQLERYKFLLTVGMESLSESSY